MKLSGDEVSFLRQWIYDEAHYETGQGPAKRMQIQHGISPADLAILIAAAIPDPGAQEAASRVPSAVEGLRWPWTPDTLSARLAEGRAILKNDVLPKLS